MLRAGEVAGPDVGAVASKCVPHLLSDTGISPHELRRECVEEPQEVVYDQELAVAPAAGVPANAGLGPENR